MSAAAINIRKNAEDYKNYLSDLQSWESEIKAKDQAAKTAKPAQTPPVRQAASTAAPPLKQKPGAAGMVGVRTGTSIPITTREDSQPPAQDTDRALIEKEKGNAWFKKGDYERAVSCYTRSMQLDPSNAVLPVNRAMAYLKINKYEEAEADSTQGLKIDAKNVKALWRRGICRRELGKFAESKADFEKALVLEPTNKAVKDDLQKLVEKRARDAEALARPIRRRLEIEEVCDEDAKPIFMDVDSTRSISPLLTPAASRITSFAPKPAATPPQTATVPEVAAKVSPVKRAAPASPARTASPAPRRVITPISPANRTYTVPGTMYEFERDWKSVKRDPAVVYSYLKAIDPANYLKIFKNSLESDYLSTILAVLSTQARNHNDVSFARECMLALSRLPRFAMTAMFLSKTEKQTVRDLVAWMKAEAGAAAELDALLKAYDAQ
ncbi:RNA polymerase II-associated protein 3 [Geranomyces variabilis]|uniref:RNA polymerase II-associated protein 3 n=1 Tax=Geranomyces variabilis TaxID=109894 RepID=A0AAD5TPS5_9FUNG|nr:RNA polymerase II-associated protein 3 [Geranomyces variabilis]